MDRDTDNSMLEIYLRKTDGKGERVLLDPKIPIRLFYHNVATLFKV